MIKIKKCSGFTLIEVAIVLLIIGLLISAAIMPLGAQRDTSNIKKAREDLKTIEEAIYGYAIATGRLPCPAQPGSGAESPVGGGDCANNSIGFVPSTTLGLSGKVNCDNLLVDPWGNPYRYSVSISNNGGGATYDFTTGGDISAVTVAGLGPDLQVCANNACVVNEMLTSQAVAVIFSMGKNWPTLGGADEVENAGEATVPSGCGAAYNVGADNDYVSHTPIETAGNEFNDIVTWISPNILYAKLLAAGQL